MSVKSWVQTHPEDRIVMDWRLVPEFMPNLWNDMVNHFHKVHKKHVMRVQRNMYALAEEYYHTDYLLMMDIHNRAQRHDDSKLKEPEHTPYVWRYYRTKFRAEGEPEGVLYTLMHNAKLDQAIQDATWYHVRHNRHHADWHLDSDDMTHLDIIEMCSDWMAMAQEHKTDIDAWVDDSMNRRYRFGKVKQQLILETIAKLKEKVPLHD